MSDYGRLFRTTEEQVEPVQATISGNIPDWIKGSIIQLGPGIFDLDSGFTLNHYFDGYAVLSKFEITNGNVEYSKKYLQSEAYNKAQKNGKPVFYEFGTRGYIEPNEVSRGFLARVLIELIPDMSDNCNINIIKQGDSYFAINGTSIVRVVNPDTLDTGEKIDFYGIFGSYLSGITVIKDNFTGDSYVLSCDKNINLNSDNLLYNIFRIPKNTNKGFAAFQDAKIITSSQATYKNYFYHYICVTENYIVHIENPLIFTIPERTVGEGGSHRICIKWLPDMRNKFSVIEKSSGRILPVNYESDKSNCFLRPDNIINCYEDDGEIILDLTVHETCNIYEPLLLSNLRSGKFDPTDNVPQSRRYVIPLIQNIQDVKEGENLVKTQPDCKAIRYGDKIQLSHYSICSEAHELKTINDKYAGKKYRYYYASGFLFAGQYQSSVIKVDVETRDVKKYFVGDGQTPSRPVFIESPNSTCEDDGILLVSTTSSITGDSDKLVILNASTMQLMASASIPCHVPLFRTSIFVEK